MSTVVLDKPIFTKMIRTKGSLISSFVFTKEEDVDRWKREELPKLRSQYGDIVFAEHNLWGLGVGDSCRVLGEGLDTFEIVGIKRYSKDRYGFNLAFWCTEEVAKCYPLSISPADFV